MFNYKYSIFKCLVIQSTCAFLYTKTVTRKPKFLDLSFVMTLVQVKLRQSFGGFVHKTVF